MRLNFICLCLFLIQAVDGGMAAAAIPSGDVTVEIAPSTYELSIGDSLSIFCTVTLPEGVKSGEPYLPDDHSSVDITKLWHTTEKTPAGVVSKRYCFLTYVFASDTLRIGPFRIDYTKPDDDKSFALSDVLTFVVKGFITDTEASLKPNRRPFEITSKTLLSRVIIALILAALVIAAIVIYLLRRKKPVLQPEPVKPINEIGEFERIRAMKLHESGRIKDLYILTSSAMRGFMHRNMGFEALYDTTEEILSQLSRETCDTEVSHTIHEIFNESDMVKFAKHIPPIEKSSTVVDRALQPVMKVLDDIAREKERLAAEQEEKKRYLTVENLHGNREGGN